MAEPWGDLVDNDTVETAVIGGPEDGGVAPVPHALGRIGKPLSLQGSPGYTLDVLPDGRIVALHSTVLRYPFYPADV